MPTPPPDTSFVPWGLFEWLMTAFAATLAWLFRRHLQDDDARFKEEREAVARMHLENQQAIARESKAVADRQKEILAEIAASRREFVSLLLQRNQ